MRSTMSTAVILIAGSLALADGPGQAGGGARPGQPGQPGVPVQPGRPGFQPGQPPGPEQMREMMIKNMARNFGLRIPPVALKWGGMVIEPADAALLAQLDLPAGKGMVVTSVEAESPAATAGLKKHDLIVKLNEQAIPGDARELLKTIGDAMANTPVDLTVVRKAKEQTLKGVKLAQAELAGGPAMGLGGPGFPPPLPLPPPGVGAPVPAPVPVAPGAPGVIGIGIGVNAQGLDGRVAITRNNEKFDADYQKDKLHVTVRGKVENNQTKIDQITVDDGSKNEKYQKVEDVPPAHRTTVQRLLQMVNGNGGVVAPPPPPPPGARGVPPAPPDRR
jgi:membrane-associated protease RseP (regulator of RpoE activity)